MLHRDAPAQVPVLRMLGQGEAELKARAERLCAAIGAGAAVEPTTGFAGGGALPEERIASRGVQPVRAPGCRRMCWPGGCGRQRPAVVGRIAEGRFVLDVLTVADDEVAGDRRRGDGAARGMRRLVVGVIGHVDHGKTALVRALTGMETDRLPEEKRRGHLDRARLRALPGRAGQPRST